jgi:cell division protein FtsQ
MTATRARGSGRVDPRLAARRASVAKKATARRRRVIALISAIATVAIVAIAVANSSWFDVDAIDVVGADRADPRQIVNASGIELGLPLHDIDVSDATTGVEQVPWVAEASVDRAIDGTVTITVTERVGVIAIPAGTRFALVDRTGRQLELVETRPAAFLAVEGVEASGVPGQPVDDAGLAVVSLAEALTPQVREATSGISFVDDRLQLQLTVGGRADLGDERGLDEKLVALETILARVDLACIATVDVRVPGAPTVRRVTPADTRAGQAEATTGIEAALGSKPADEEPFDGPGGC